MLATLALEAPSDFVAVLGAISSDVVVEWKTECEFVYRWMR